MTVIYVFLYVIVVSACYNSKPKKYENLNQEVPLRDESAFVFFESFTKNGHFTEYLS